MEDKYYKDLKDSLIFISKSNEDELESISEEIEEVIESKIDDEDTISRFFDRLLSLMFIDEDLLKKSYFKLIEYTRNFNKELADDYKELYYENIESDN